MEAFVAGWLLFFTLENIFAVIIGLTVGILIGALPGLNVPMIVSLMLPFTFTMAPVAGLSLLLGIYKGGTQGGSIASILINTPGTPAAAATCADGYPLAQQGKAGKALNAAIYGSVIGQFLADIVLISVAVQIAMVALRFGPSERLAIVIFALVAISLVSTTGNKLKGIAAGLAGIFVYSIGLDPVSGVSRFTFGQFQLIAGIPFLPLLIGLFAISEFFTQLETRLLHGKKEMIKISKNKEDNRVTWAEFKQNFPTIIRSSLIGIGIGAIPGPGSAISAFVCYGAAKNASKHPEKFGKGALEGVFAPETGGNATIGGSLIPLLTLGIPGDAVTAIMLGAFLVHGIIPGPELFTVSANMVYAIFITLIVSNIFHLFIAKSCLKIFVKAVSFCRTLLYPAIIVICFAGVFTSNSNIFDVRIMIIFGILGYIMKKTDFSIPTFLIGYILGPLFEISLIQTAIIFEGNIISVLQRPIVLFFVILTVVFLVWTAVSHKRRQKAK